MGEGERHMSFRVRQEGASLQAEECGGICRFYDMPAL